MCDGCRTGAGLPGPQPASRPETCKCTPRRGREVLCYATRPQERDFQMRFPNACVSTIREPHTNNGIDNSDHPNALEGKQAGSRLELDRSLRHRPSPVPTPEIELGHSNPHPHPHLCPRLALSSPFALLIHYTFALPIPFCPAAPWPPPNATAANVQIPARRASTRRHLARPVA